MGRTKRHAWNDDHTGALCGLTFGTSPSMRMVDETNLKVSCGACREERRRRHRERHPNDMSQGMTS